MNPEDTDAVEMLEMEKSYAQRMREREDDPEWQKDNLEYDLRTSKTLVDKVKNSEFYSQNLYAALCNNEFIKNDVWPLLSDKRWGCSWRYAGGILANMREEGDYIDWYCSGIRGQWSDEEFQNATKEDQEKYLDMQNKYVGESVVTDEIRQDLLEIGWLVANISDTDFI